MKQARSATQQDTFVQLPVVEVIYLFIFINRSIRSFHFSAPNPANTLMNMPAKMKMKAPVSASKTPQDRLILMGEKKEKIEKSLPRAQLVNVLI